VVAVTGCPQGHKDSKHKFTALLHHINEDSLNRSFFKLKKTAAVGVDGVTWFEYERDLEANLKDLHPALRSLIPAELHGPPRDVTVPPMDHGSERNLTLSNRV
jgi:hypothetical protein